MKLSEAKYILAGPSEAESREAYPPPHSDYDAVLPVAD